MKKKMIIISLIILFMLIILFCKNSFASYISSLESKGSASIAEPIFIVEGDEKITIDKYNFEGTYKIKIKNYENDKISDCKLQYCIEFNKVNSNIIKLELIRENEVINIEDNKTQYIEINNDNKITHEYILKISCKDNISEENINLKENLEINVTAVQVK